MRSSVPPLFKPSTACSVETSPLAFPAIAPHSDAPYMGSPQGQGDHFARVAEQLTNRRVRGLAPNLWSHLLKKCSIRGARSDSQRGRWSEYRLHLVRDRVVKASRPQATPPALVAGLLQVAEANGVAEPNLEAIDGLMKLRRDPAGSK